MEVYITQIISIILLLILIPIGYTGMSLAPWVPTRAKDLKRIHKLAKLNKKSVFFELGCGNARVCHYIAGKNPFAKVIGIELAYSLYFWGLLKNFFSPRKNLSIKLQNIFNTDISNADVIYVYGMPKTLERKLKQKLEKELKKGAKIISYVFKIKGWKPLIHEKKHPQDASIYVYEKH